MQYLPYLDGWRGLAIGFLLVGHFFPIPGINLGAVGVNLFFVLSGFLMGRILFVEQVPLALFYRRRIARIFPALFVFLGVVTGACLILGRTVDWRESALAAALVNNYFPGLPGAAVMPFGHIWSLSVEEHSYVVLSLAALAVRAHLARARTVAGGLALLSAGAGAWYWYSYTGTRLGFDRWLRTEVSAFGIMASAFLLLCFHGRKMARLPLPVVPTLAVLGLALHWWSLALPVTTIAGVGALALAINLLEDAPPVLLKLLSVRPLRQFGIWSFSIYLWQQPFYLLVHRTGLPAAAGVALALAAGVASFYVVEQPARRWLNRRGARSAEAYCASYAPMSSALTTGRETPEARCRYTAPGLSGTPAAETATTEPALTTSGLAVGRKS